MALGRLELIQDEPAAAPPQDKAQTAVTVQMLSIALTALSKRFVTAAASLVDFALIASVFAVWWSIVANPSPLQMETASIYSVFILSVIWLRSRGRNA